MDTVSNDMDIAPVRSLSNDGLQHTPDSLSALRLEAPVYSEADTTLPDSGAGKPTTRKEYHEKLKNSGFALDGKQVNGLVTKDGIMLNIDSAKAMNAVVGHEIMHVLKGTEHFKYLTETAYNCAIAKDGLENFNKRLKETEELYKGMDADPNEELAADLIGEYLFTDPDFISRLSTENRNVFQKIYDEIKYLCKVATAGSKEARELEKVKRLFEKAYREGGKSHGETKYSLSIKHTDGSVEELADARRLTTEQAVNYLNQAKSGGLRGDTYIPIRSDTPQVLIDTLEQVNEHIENLSLVMNVNKAKGAMAVENPGTKTKKHGDNVRKHGLSPEEIVEIINNLDNPDTVVYQTNRHEKNGESLPNSVAVFVEFTSDGRDGMAAVEFENPRNTDSIGMEFGETNYHTVVTVFEPDIERYGMPFDYVEELLSNPDNQELRIERRQPNESATREKHPNTSNELPSNKNVAQQNPSVNVKISPEDSDIAPVKGQFQSGDTYLDAPIRNTGSTSYAENSDSVPVNGEDTAPVMSISDLGEQHGDGVKYSISDSEGKQLTKEQQDYFKNSKVIDENGNLLVVYNGSTSRWTVPNKGGKPQWWSASKEYSDEYRGKNGIFDYKNHTVKAYIKITNPLDVGNTDWFFEPSKWNAGTEKYSQQFMGIADKLGVDAESLAETANKYGNRLFHFVNTDEFINMVKDAGFDGIKANEFGATTYATFRPEQAKKTTNKHPTSDMDIRHSLSDIGEQHTPDSLSALRLDAPVYSESDMPIDAPVVGNSTTQTGSQGGSSSKVLEEHKARFNPKNQGAISKALEKKGNRTVAKFMAALVDKGAVFEDLALATGNRRLIGKWNQTLNASSMAQRMIGRGNDSVSSLVSIRDKVSRSGKTEQFHDYMYHRLNIDHMTLKERGFGWKKPVFGDGVTAEMSRQYVEKANKENPEFEQLAKEVYAYNEYLRQMLVDNGVITQKIADLWAEMYPNYVRIRREVAGEEMFAPLSKKNVKANPHLKQAVGGNQKIIPLFDTMAQHTIQTFDAIARNNFGVELMNTLMSQFMTITK